MKINSIFGKVAGRSAHFVLNKLGRGSSLPGKIALQFDPEILKELARNYEVVVITGTNGKTLTTALTVGILKEAFGEVVTNPSGANMISGITSTFLAAKGKSGRNIAVLEIDEASLSKITEHIKPSLVVFTNIFRDQLDRFGEIYTTYQMILDGVAKSPDTTILANGDSPLFYKTGLSNPIKYYGFDTEKTAEKRAHFNTEGILCPNCHQILNYRLNVYANLGDYTCPNCGTERPALDYRLTELIQLTHQSSEFVIDGQSYKINVGGLYNIYNALAAVAVAQHLGVDAATIKAGFDKSRAVFGRQETFTLGDKTATIILVKNPVGASQTLDMLALDPKPFNLAVLLNADYADGIDTSWIWDANFEKITELNIPHLYAGGVRHSEIARRLRVTGYPVDQMTNLDSLESLLAGIQAQDTDHTYILATYTAMLQLRELLTQKTTPRKEGN